MLSTYKSKTLSSCSRSFYFLVRVESISFYRDADCYPWSIELERYLLTVQLMLIFLAFSLFLICVLENLQGK